MTNWTVANAPDQTGRVAVVTGANTGLGYETAAALASRGARVVLAVRNLDKGKAAADLIARRYPGADVSVQELDLTSLASIAAGQCAGGLVAQPGVGAGDDGGAAGLVGDVCCDPVRHGGVLS
jgi:uncharacterized protein YbjT (DUF2867 family)